MDTLKAIRKPKIVSLGTDRCFQWGSDVSITTPVYVIIDRLPSWVQILKTLLWTWWNKRQNKRSGHSKMTMVMLSGSDFILCLLWQFSALCAPPHNSLAALATRKRFLWSWSSFPCLIWSNWQVIANISTMFCREWTFQGYSDPHLSLVYLCGVILYKRCSLN